MGRNTDSSHSTAQQASVFVEKVYQTGRAVSNSLRKSKSVFRLRILKIYLCMKAWKVSDLILIFYHVERFYSDEQR